MKETLIEQLPLLITLLVVGIMFYFAIKGSAKARKKRETMGQRSLEDLKTSDILNKKQRSQTSLTAKRKATTSQQKISLFVLVFLSWPIGIIYGISLFLRPIATKNTNNSTSPQSTNQETEQTNQETLIYDKNQKQNKSPSL